MNSTPRTGMISLTQVGLEGPGPVAQNEPQAAMKNVHAMIWV